jgi:hypothetical protein
MQFETPACTISFLYQDTIQDSRLIRIHFHAIQPTPILECILGLCSKQGDITCTFLHAKLGKNKTVYIEMPQGFMQQYNKQGRPKVLKLK